MASACLAQGKLYCCLAGGKSICRRGVGFKSVCTTDTGEEGAARSVSTRLNVRQWIFPGGAEGCVDLLPSLLQPVSLLLKPVVDGKSSPQAFMSQECPA